MNIFILDYETTGLSPYFDGVTEVAIKKLNENHYYQTLVKPPINGIHYKYVSAANIKITGITNEMIDEHGIETNISLFNTIKYIENHSGEGPIYIVAHNGNNFDFILLKRMIFNYHGEPLNTDIINRIHFIDTLNLAKAYIRNERHNQPGLCKKYQIINESTHRALGDVNALEKLYIKMCEQFSFFKKKTGEYYLNNPSELVQNLFI
jgi:DNA polymerase III alpha subunit (gram-positive type)